MTTTFATNVSAIELVTDKKFTNIVKFLKFELVASDGELSATSFNTFKLTYPKEENFIPYESLTAEQVYAWVVNIVGESEIEAMKAGLTTKLQELKVQETPW